MRVSCLSRLTRLLLISCTWMLLACSSQHESGQQVRVARGMTLQLQLPDAQSTQVHMITGTYREQSHRLIMQIESSRQHIALAGLTPTGTRLFSLDFNGETVTDWQSPLFQAPFKGAYVLADHQLAHYPLPRLKSALPADCTLEETTRGDTRTRRLLNRHGTEVIHIEYTDRMTRYCHRERLYCLHIETVSSTP
jgi:hypothetical protein